MIEEKINRLNLEIFLDNIRDSDKAELIYYYGANFRQSFIKAVFKYKNTTKFLSYNSIPSCIGGTCEDNIGLKVWLLCAKKYDKKFLFKYLKSEVEMLKKQNKVLYNVIYKSNFSAIKWLKKLGFVFSDTNNPDFKLFYL